MLEERRNKYKVMSATKTRKLFTINEKLSFVDIL